MDNKVARRTLLVLRAFALGVWCLSLAPQICFAELLPVAFDAASPSRDPGGNGVAGSCVRMVGGLFLCLGLFALGVHVFRRYAAKHGTGTKRRLVIRERLPISPKASLLVVALDGKEFLVSTGSDRVTFASTHNLATNDFSVSLSEACAESEAFNA